MSVNTAVILLPANCYLMSGNKQKGVRENNFFFSSFFFHAAAVLTRQAEE